MTEKSGPNAAGRGGAPQGSSREFVSRLLLALGAFPMAFGWLFLVSGIGIVYLALGVVMIIVGVGLNWSWRRVGFGIGAMIAGSSPILFLLVWIVLGLGD